MNYLLPLAELIEQFQKLPGVGAKSAQRLAFQVLSWKKEEIEKFAQSLIKASREVSYCPEWCTLSLNGQLCNICDEQQPDSSASRNKQQICIVSGIKDLIALERTREYQGSYHVLHGLISPLDGIRPEDLKIKELIARIKRAQEQESEIEEIILAISPSTEGEATSLYLIRLLKPFVKKLSRLAFGISVGVELEQTDELTLGRALHGRSVC